MATWDTHAVESGDSDLDTYPGTLRAHLKYHVTNQFVRVKGMLLMAMQWLDDAPNGFIKIHNDITLVSTMNVSHFVTARDIQLTEILCHITYLRVNSNQLAVFLLVDEDKLGPVLL